MSVLFLSVEQFTNRTGGEKNKGHKQMYSTLFYAQETDFVVKNKCTRIHQYYELF